MDLKVKIQTKRDEVERLFDYYNLPSALKYEMVGRVMLIFESSTNFEPAEQSEPLTDEQILGVFGKYAECIYDHDDYFINGNKFIDAVNEILASHKAKPEQKEFCEILEELEELKEYHRSLASTNNNFDGAYAYGIKKAIDVIKIKLGDK